MTATDFKYKIISLSNRLFPMVKRLLGSEEHAADAMQEIMIKLWNKRGKIAAHPSINGFVFLTAKNYCLDLIKKNKIQTDDISNSLEHGTPARIEQEMEWNELKKIVNEILRQLPEQQKEVMLLRDIDGLEFDEIAEIMELKIEHVRVLLSRARKKVAEELKTKYSYEH